MCYLCRYGLICRLHICINLPNCRALISRGKYMTETTVAAPPKLPAKPSEHQASPERRLDVGLPNLLKGLAYVVGFVGVLAGLSMLIGVGLGSQIPGVSVIIGSLWSAVWIYAFGDIVLSLRKVAFNTAK